MISHMRTENRVAPARVPNVQRVLLVMIGAGMLWSAPHWAALGLDLRHSGAPGAADYLAVTALQLILASFCLYVGVRGRAPRWAD
jgi:hypothetical protein